jgi:Ni,Fe-hydrogenase maturation factor
LPEITVVTISIEELKPMTMDLSPTVEAAVPVACDTVRKILEQN